MAIMEPDQLKAILTIPRTSLLPPARVSAILSSAPFVSIPGTFNARCLSSHSAFPTAISPNLAFRTGSLERLTLEGQDVLKTLGIKTIFDLRSLKERSEFPEPEIDGIKVIWMPTTVVDETTPAAQAEKQLRKDSGVFSLITMYMDMLRTHATAYAGVLKHVGAHPGEPFLFHCTAGKDRTGTLAFLLEDLAGSSVESMNIDYALTRVGVEPVRDFLIHKLMGGRDLPTEEVQRIMSSPKMAAYSEIP